MSTKNRGAGNLGVVGWLVRACAPNGKATAGALFTGLLLLSQSAAAATGKPVLPVKPEWQGSLARQSADGEASLSWQTGSGVAPDIMRVTEKINGETRVFYAAGETLEVFRASPGLYRFSLEGCLRAAGEVPVCGPASKELSLAVTEDIYSPYLQARPVAPAAAPQQAAITGGPAALRPGRWFNPNKSGIGWSMYWSNRLEMSQNPSNVFDLQVIWYTYEAKRVVSYCDGPNDTCPPLVSLYFDYRPVVATMSLAKHSSNSSYVGAISIRRDGVERNVGNATLNFGTGNATATIQWSASFKKEALSGSDNITLLAGGDGSSASDATSNAGLYGNTLGTSFVAADIGSLSQTLGAVFYDNNGDPTWVMAHKYVAGIPPATGLTHLCYYYTPGGYPPNQDQPGLLAPFHTTCDPEAATASNRNGSREFTNVETGRFWISFSLPPGETNENRVAGGSLALGTAAAPATLTKVSNHHRIWFSGEAACQVGSSAPSCSVPLTWYTGSDYPNASVWVVNQSTGQRTLVTSAAAAAVENHAALLSSAGSYQFELYQGSSTSSTKLASSSVFTVTQVTGVPATPTGLGASWTNEATRAYRLDWTHPSSGSVSLYVITESVPGGSSATFNVSPGSLMTRSFFKSTGPWGTYSYRVKACNSSGQCSADTAQLQWLVTDPAVPVSAPVQQPWKTNQYGSLVVNQNYQYAMGYNFVPAVAGQVTQLGGYFSGSKMVKLFRRSTGALLASANISSSNAWSFVNITPVALTAGEQYTVAAYLAGSGASARASVAFPKTYGDITILSSAYASTASNPNAVPTVEESVISMYGQADVSFVPGSTPQPPPGGQPAFSDSFEIGEWSGLWTEDSQNDWTRATQRATDGTWSAEVDGGASDAQLISIPIDLQGATSATVEFDWLIETSLDGGEYLAFDVSTNGGTSWAERARLRGDVDTENTWRHENIAVTGIGSLRLRFRALMSGSDEDANVDSVKVSKSAVAANTPPVVTAPANQSHVSGSVIAPLAISVADAESDPVTCSITGLPAGLTESSECAVSGTITAAANTYAVTVTANDGKASSTPVNFNWTVTAPAAIANPELPPAPSAAPSMTPGISSSRVGATAGSFSVTEGGHATYTIPLMVAAGSGGMSPPLSLDYSSSSGNGPLGMGWSLGGQSAISRCPQTLEQDGPSAIRGVTLTSADRFCLDGQRLMLIAGSYGSAGSEYRTEIDSISKVIANGVAGTGPASFTVWRKDGSITEYGNSADSRIEARAADSQTVLLWAQNRVSDSAGNYITYSYYEAAGSQGDAVEFALEKIAYTGNSRANTAPFAEINLIYDDARADKQVAYLSGAATMQSKRMVRIDSRSRIDAGGALQFLRSYLLTYSGDPAGRSLLASVEECRDSSRTYCFGPTVINWQLRNDAINTASTGSFSLPTILYGLTLGDTNGDARPDVLYTQKSGSQYQLKTALAQASGGFSVASGSAILPLDANDKPVKVMAIDLNADGRQDLIYTRDSGSGPDWYVQMAGSSSFVLLAPAATDSPSLLKVMDFDGDGLSDLFYGHTAGPGPSQQLVWQRNTFVPGGSAGLAAPQPITVELADLFPDSVADSDPGNPDRWFVDLERPSFEAEANPVRSQVFDFNGDGAVDLLVKVARHYCQGQCGFEPGSSATDSLVQPKNLQPGPFEAPEPEPADSPAVGNTAVAAFWVVYESNGLNDFKPARVVARDWTCTLGEVCDTFASYPLVTDPQPVDVNVDGLADLLYRRSGEGWLFRLNTGGAFALEQTIPGHLQVGIHHAAQVQDVNGDGWPDLLYPSAPELATAKWAVHLNQRGLGFGAAQLTVAPVGNSLDKDFGVFADFTGDGKLDQLFVNLSSLGEVQGTELHLGGNSLSAGSVAAIPSSVVTRIVDGFGAATSISYRPLTDPGVYTRMQDSANANWGKGSAVYDLVAPLYVVSLVERSAPTYASASATSKAEYHYVGAKLQAGGRGFLGFGEVISYDPQSGIRTNTRYRQDFPYIGLPADTSQAKVTSTQKFHTISSTTAVTPVNWGTISATTVAAAIPSGTRLSHAINQWSKRETYTGKGVWYPFVANSLERAYTLAGGFSKKVLTTSTYNNDYGNLDQVAISTYAADDSVVVATQSTSNAYQNNTSNWHLGRFTSSTVTHTRSGKPSIVRNSTFGYDALTGILNRETIEPNSPQHEVVTNHYLDNFGNRIETTVKGYGMPTRFSGQIYDSLGRYADHTYNSYNQWTSRVLQRDVFGNALQAENIDGVLTVSAADYMGRAFIAWTETGAWQKALMASGPGSLCPSANTAFHTITTSGGQGSRVVCTDNLGREVRTASQGFNGTYVYVDTDYDDLGRVARVSLGYRRPMAMT
jgi:hypothetical protein